MQYFDYKRNTGKPVYSKLGYNKLGYNSFGYNSLSYNSLGYNEFPFVTKHIVCTERIHFLIK